ncbi:MAG: calcium-binding protein [Gemmobacter sp.]
MFWLFWKLNGSRVHEGISGNVNDLATTARVWTILHEPGLDKSLFPGVAGWSPGGNAYSASGFFNAIPVILTQTATYTADLTARFGLPFVHDRIARAPVSADGTIGTPETLFLTTLRGNRLDNRITGTEGPDDIFGLAGNDTLRGGEKSDFLYGGPGRDVLHGEGRNDRLWGGDGRDRLFGGDGNDTIWGGRGADVLFGGGGSDVLYGGAGADRIFTGDAFLRNTAYGGAGDDYIELGGGAGAAYGETGSDTIIAVADGVYELFGGAGNDLLIGGLRVRPARIEGGAGNDTIEGLGTFYGGAGNDTLVLREGREGEGRTPGEVFDADLYGGPGRDRFVFVIDTDRPTAVLYRATIRDFEPGEIIDLSQTGLGGFDELGVTRFQSNSTITIFTAQVPMARAAEDSELRITVRHPTAMEIGADYFVF